MNKHTLIHIAAEVLVITTVTVFLMKKTKKAETGIRYVQDQLEESNKKIASLEKHIDSLYQMIEALGDQSNLFAPSAKETKKIASPPEGPRRRHKFSVRPMPLHEEDDKLQSTRQDSPRSISQSPPKHANGPSPVQVTIPVLPMEALFNVMAGGIHSNEPISRQDDSPPVIVEEEDDTDIAKELEMLKP